MSLVDVDSWNTEYDACKRLSQNILSQIDKKEYDYQSTENIQLCMKQFETELNVLKNRLQSSSKQITFEESQKRQRQIDSLQDKLVQLKRKITTNSRFTRSEILFPSTSRQQPIDSDDDIPIIDDKKFGVEKLKQRQIQLMEEQNRGLDALSQTISRQRQLATQLGQEVEEQNELIDNLADTMERIDVAVSLETSNIGLINRRDNTCGYWIVIIALFFAILIVSVI